MKVVAKAKFFMEGDSDADEYQAKIVEHAGARWLVATWLQPNDGGAPIPERLIPMDALPHSVLPNGIVQLGLLMPRQWLSAEAPMEQLLPVGTVVNPLLLKTRRDGNIH